MVFCPGTLQLLNLAGQKGTSRPKLLGYKSYLCQMLHRLYLHERFEERRSIAHGAVIRQQDGIMRGKVWTQALCYFLCSRRRISSQGHAAKSHNGFLAKHLVECSP